MPFTAAHPAAVIPLLRGGARARLDATALVCGAMAPDFEYFLRARMQSTVSHTAEGLLLFDVPVALAMAALYHLLLRAPLAAASSGRITSESTWWRRRPGGWAVVVLSAAVGAATHLAWDGFTHRTGAGVALVPWLAGVTPLGPLGPHARYRLLQHASTLVGAAIVLWHLWSRAAPARPVNADTLRARALLVLSCLTGAALVVAVQIGAPRSADALWRLRGHAVVATISGALLGWCAAGLLWRLTKQPERPYERSG